MYVLVVSNAAIPQILLQTFWPRPGLLLTETRKKREERKAKGENTNGCSARPAGRAPPIAIVRGETISAQSGRLKDQGQFCF